MDCDNYLNHLNDYFVENFRNGYKYYFDSNWTRP